MWIGWIVLVVSLQISLAQEAETGNSLVTCATCQTLQAQIDNWSCDINCQVANGNNGKMIYYFVYNFTDIHRKYGYFRQRLDLNLISFCRDVLGHLLIFEYLPSHIQMIW